MRVEMRVRAEVKPIQFILNCSFWLKQMSQSCREWPKGGELTGSRDERLHGVADLSLREQLVKGYAGVGGWLHLKDMDNSIIS